ncbi:murein-DD-endopeptidase. Serine peptidase. MEROPS family S11 [Marinobacterium lutimaris]|uniref:Murein-DD-endopeptidase. Serine peptidase. MEROPS family S11 n=2 Tax=Marinobacterium lutimaris TaxID=568106 RepID=A0A1H6DID6_9GAMM|nr:murein-DD-endopeptidase. Serine peptidase. MEROPS family S11 [Marinobacterium lutimaris]
MACFILWSDRPKPLEGVFGNAPPIHKKDRIMLYRIRLTLTFILLLWSGLVSARQEPDAANLQLASVNALVVNLDTGRVLYQKNPDAVVPIASVSKLMTALVALEADQPMDEPIPIQVRDSIQMQNVISRIRIGSELPREDVLQLAIMSSENRAATALAHAYPGGYFAFVRAMNLKAEELGMSSTRFVEPTGLSYFNVSTANDLVKLIRAARKHPEIRKMTTSSKMDARFREPRYVLAFYNTNRLVNSDDWDIELSKTGYNDAAGRCLVMVSEIEGQDIAMVFLDSFGKRSHIGDAGRVKRWLETGDGGDVPRAAARYERDKNKVGRRTLLAEKNR